MPGDGPIGDGPIGDDTSVSDTVGDTVGDDTIVAVATPPGRGALAVVRLAGPAALRVARALGATCDTPRHLVRARLVHPVTGAPLDDATVVHFAAPHSPTGGDVVEFFTHGGFVVPETVVAACIAAGARVAEPGEFTRRAVLAGKLDVLQAEALADLVDATATSQQAAALAQLDGGLSRRIEALRQDVVALDALLAYDIDFPEEDDGPVSPARITGACASVLHALDALLASAPAVPLLRDGAIVVIAGAPNAGKSSLFNALAGERRAIVTDVPGTTRDALEVRLDGAAVPLRLIDTAGLRESDDVVERLGIEVGAEWLRRAHVILACGESEGAIDAVEAAVQAAGACAAPCLRVRTKGDVSAGDANGDGTPGARSHVTSARSGAGLTALRAAIDDVIATRYGAIGGEAPRLTRERHQRALREARDELIAFRDAWSGGEGVPAAIAAAHLRGAIGALESLIGVVDVEDVLDVLFRDFCVGK